MRLRKIIFCLPLLAMIWGFQSEIHAYYDLASGRFISRDPIGSASGHDTMIYDPQDPESSQIGDDLAQIAVRTDTMRLGSAIAAQSQGRAFQRDAIQPMAYADGLNLYQYTRSSPTIYADPLGLMSEECWNKQCRDTGLMLKQMVELEKAARGVDGYKYGSYFKGDVGCGWCARRIYELLSALPPREPQCWEFQYREGHKWLIGTGYIGFPDIDVQHQFVAIRKNIDGISMRDDKNRSSPVFDGWGGLWGNITGRCKYSVGTVGDYSDKYIVWNY